MVLAVGEYIDGGKEGAHGKAVCDLYIRESKPE